MISSHQRRHQHAGTSHEYRVPVGPMWLTGRCLFSSLKYVCMWICVCVHGFVSDIQVAMGEPIWSSRPPNLMASHTHIGLNLN